MNKKKISVILVDGFPVPSVKGGAVETLMESFLDINEQQKKVEVVFYSIYDKSAEELSSKYKFNKIHYIRVSRFREVIYKFFRKIAKLFVKYPYKYYYYKALKMIQKEKTDLIIFEGGALEGWGMDLFKKSAPLCFHLHFHGVPERPVTVYDSIIGVSNYVADKWAETSPNQKRCVVHNGVDTERFLNCDADRNELRGRFNISENEFVLLYVGRIVEVKGIYELVCALDGLDENIKLLVIGSANFAEKTSTDYEVKVKAKIEKMKDRVIFTGYIPNEELHKYYKIADVQVIPSKWEEAAGLVAIEGMASGLPIIATKSGGMVEYVDSSCAYLVDKEENLEQNLMDAVNYLYNNESARIKMSESGRIRSEMFSRNEFYNSMVDAVNKLC